MEIRILNYLDDWLILAQSQAVLIGFNPQPLRMLGARGQLFQEHTVTQSTSFIPGHSYRLRADDSNSFSGASHDNSVPHSLLRRRYHPSAQITAFHAPIAGRSLGRDSAVIQFLRGARRINPPRPHTVPPWYLPTVLRALKGHPF